MLGPNSHYFSGSEFDVGITSERTMTEKRVVEGRTWTWKQSKYQDRSLRKIEDMEKNKDNNLNPLISTSRHDRRHYMTTPYKVNTRSKIVSKPWKQLIETPTFARTYYLNTVSKIVVYLENTPYQVIGFVDDDDVTAPKSRFPGCFKMLKFNLPLKEYLYSSAYGLFFLRNQGMRDPKQTEWIRGLYVCNPQSW